MLRAASSGWLRHGGKGNQNPTSIAALISLMYPTGSEAGPLYDFGDLTYDKQQFVGTNAQFMAAFPAHTLFQDSAGTTPVRSVEQPLGLCLDRRFAGVRGPSLVPNGIVGLVGSATAATYNTSTGAGSVTRVDVSNQSFVAWTVVTGQMHQMQITNTGSATLVVRAGTQSGTVVLTVAAGASTQGFIVGAASQITITAQNNATTATFTVSSFAVVPGIHLIQGTSGARPTMRARVNQLTASEAMNNAAWTRTDVTPTDGAATAPGGASATLLTEGSAGTATCNQAVTTVVSSAAYVYRKIFLRGNHDWVLMGVGDNLFANGVRQWVNLATGALGTRNTFGTATGVDATITSLGDGWYAVTLTVSGISSTTLRPYTHSASANAVTTRVANGTRYEAASDFRSADRTIASLPAYQRVGTSPSTGDYDTFGFPVLAAFNGTSSCMQSHTTLDLSASDKVFVAAGVRKLSDAVSSMTLETSANSFSNNGSFALVTPFNTGTANYGMRFRGTSEATPTSTSTYPSPNTSVLTGVGSIADDTAILRINGIQAASSVADQGTGNFGNYTVNVGARNAASNFLNGEVSILGIRGGTLPNASVISAIETNINLLRAYAY